jgi:hypothetical protein
MRALRQWTGALVAVFVAVACGSSGSGAGDGSSFDPDSGASTSGSSGPGSLGAGGGGDPGDGGGGDGSGGCSGLVDMYIMFDRSNSMGQDCNVGENVNSKWCHAVNALSGYFNSQSANGQAAALQYFPVAAVTDPICKSGDGYEVASLPVAPADYETLPSHAFDSILNSEAPGSGLGTPTEAAIRGISRFTDAHRRGGRVTIGILITDGDPNGCDNNLDDLAALLDAHYQATKSRTYVIGMDGATFTNLEKLAVGGNAPTHADVVGDAKDACGAGLTAPCRSWNVGNGDPAAFIAALAAIQQSADGCTQGGGFINPVK